MKSTLKPLLCALVLLSLAGCGALPGQGAPPTLYRLTPKSTFDANLPTVTWQLVLSPPDAEASIDTLRIALMSTPVQIEYFANAGWTDRATVMVQTLILESFENSGKIVGVGRRAIGLRSDYEVLMELREFQAEYFQQPNAPECAGAPVCVEVVINAKLIYTFRRTIVGQASFSARAPAEVDSLPAVIAAFDEALGAVMKDVVGWTLRTGEQDYRLRPEREKQP